MGHGKWGGGIVMHPHLFNKYYECPHFLTPFYSYSYKKKIREVIQPDFNYDSQQLHKFDNWGNRCYLLSSELENEWNHKDYIIPKDHKMKINKLNFNFSKLKSLPCDFIFSTIKIDDFPIDKIIFEKAFEKNFYPYKIYLYKVL